MQNRRAMIAMLVAMPLVLLWVTVGYPWLGRFMGYDMARPAATQPAGANTNASATTSTPTTGTFTNVSVPSTSPAAIADGVLRVVPASSVSTVQIGSDATKDTTYHLGIHLHSAGASVERVVLNEFRKTVRDADPYSFQTPYPGHESITRPLATRTVWVDGTEFNLSDVQWTLDRSDTQSAEFSIVIARGETPVVKVKKKISLLPVSDSGSGYEVLVEQGFQNLSGAPVTVKSRFNGSTLPPLEQERGGDRQILAGFGAKEFVLITHNMAEEFVKTPNKGLKADASGNPSLWAGTSSIYFNAIVRPLPLDPALTVPEYIADVSANSVATLPDGRAAVVVHFDTTEQTVAAGQSLTLPARAFFGPRKRALLKDTYYSSYPIGYDKTLVLTSGPCGFCTFDWLVNILVAMLAGFYTVSRDWGVAIIVLVVIVRLLLHPVSKKSQVSMAKMGKMAPEMERLKKKYGEDKEQLQKAMMDLYKEQGIAPMLGCLPMLLQMPIWIALWQSLQTTFELRHAPFLWGYTWIHDLSQPDHLLTWPPFHFLFFTISGLNVLPLLMGAVFYFQMKYQPKPATMTKEQEQQQKMMQWMMPVLFPLMLYSGPSGLNLYIMTSTLIGIVESKKIRDHLKTQEEREKAGRVIVDAGKKFKGGGGKEGSGGSGTPAKPKGPPGGLMGWLQKLQEKADQVKRDSDKKK